MSRGFLEVEKEYLKNSKETIMPKRGSAKSAGYDFHVKEKITLKPNDKIVVFSDVRAFMDSDEVLNLYPRSSMGIKKHIRITNGTGVIDSDYFNNPETGGNIGIALHNFGEKTIEIQAGERVCQGVFSRYLITDDDDASGFRNGGIGSTGK